MLQERYWAENTNFIRESVIVQLTSFLTGLDSTKQVNMSRYNGYITKQLKTGGQPYGDTSRSEFSVDPIL